EAQKLCQLLEQRFGVRPCRRSVDGKIAEQPYDRLTTADLVMQFRNQGLCPEGGSRVLPDLPRPSFHCFAVRSELDSAHETIGDGDSPRQLVGELPDLQGRVVQ